MKLTNKFWLSSSILALFSPCAMISAETWESRNIEDVLEDIQIDQYNQKTYTVKSGDTLGIIAEAMDLSVRHLANINGIEDINLIFPGNEITAQLNSQDEAVSLTVDTPEGDSAEVDLPVNISPISETSEEEITMPVSSAVEETQSTEEITEAPETEAPVTEASATTVEVSEEEVSRVEAAEFTDLQETFVSSSEEAESIETSDIQDESEQTMLHNSISSVAQSVKSPQHSITEATTQAPVEETTTAAPATKETTTQAPVEEATTEATTQAPVEETTTVAPATTETTTQAPVEETTTVAPATTETTTQAPVERRPANGLQPNAARFRDEVVSRYGVPVVSEVRPGDPGDHGKGKAVDFGITPGDALGDEVAQFAVDQRNNYGITYVIWEQKINGDWNQNQWESMEDRGSVTANHYDHVHVSFK